jgi:outer membrane biosynthesis protein TonB
MSTTHIPSQEPAAPGRPQVAAEGDLYDVKHWESAYRNSTVGSVPTLLVQLQDDLSRSRLREAFWISVVVHLFLVIVIVNSPRIARLFPHRAALLVMPNDMRQKELTYLELPSDVQKITKPPDTNIISDKNRIATSKTPHLDPKELKRILDSARPGPPGPSGPPQQQPQPTQPPAAAQNAPPIPQQTQAPPPPPPSDQVAKLTAPAPANPRPFGGAMSAGSAVEQAARAAAASRGGGGGVGGDYGLGQGRQPTTAVGNLDVLSDTMGVDFGPYLSRVLHDVRINWYNLIPEVARPPLMKKGKVAIEFAILKDGRVAELRRVATSGDISLDRAAWGGITASNPFPPLPGEFGGQYLALRFYFYYNPDENELR